tara:strand:- start:5397 stop:5930 length:534 start_codon:yes stop_codon:yes gene_type:complete
MTPAEKLSKIQIEFKAKKSRFNSFGKYNFRSAEDILEALKPINEKYRVYFTINENFIFTESLPVIETKASMVDIDDPTNPIIATAIVGVDMAQKGMATPQQFGSASSYAKKYALGNLLLIDDTADADATNDHGKRKPRISSDNLEKAKKFLNNGGLLKTLQSQYDIAPEVLKELQSE